MQNIGARIKELRKKNDLTQERLADFLGVTDKAVSKWECGLTAPDLALIMPLSRILNVSADELLSGNQNETNKRRAEFNERCDNFLKYDMKENYRIASQAVSEYPRDYKYLSWLATMEMHMAYYNEYKEESSELYSVEMLERAIRHNNIVIEECQDQAIKYDAIWNAMVCFKNMNRYDEALNYAKMIPVAMPYNRDGAMEMCLQGKKLIEHRQWTAYKKLLAFCISLSRIYWFATKKETYAISALDTEENILKSVIPDSNYLEFHKNLCCAYQKRAEFEVIEGNYEKAVGYLRTMMEHATKIPYKKQSFTCGMLNGLSVDFSQDRHLLYIITGVDDLNKPVEEQLKNRITTLELYTPLWERDDFKALLK